MDPLRGAGAHRDPLTNDDVAQCIDYFAASDCAVVLLFNLCRRGLDWKRLFPPREILAYRRKRWRAEPPGS